MMTNTRSLLAALLLLSTAPVVPQAQAPASRTASAAPIAYRFTFPAPEHRWMQVEASFTQLGAAPLELRMSRSSPGRYSLHEFAKNLYDLEVSGADGRPIEPDRPESHAWTVAGHGGAATVRYKVFGDRLDGTYLAIDPTHAHINMPAVIMWARGLEDRPSTLRFEQPAGRAWQVATQLYPGPSPLQFTAPNLQYLMDSPAEFGPGDLRSFTVGAHTFRLAVHHNGRPSDVDRLLRDIQAIVVEQVKVYGEFPSYEPGHYTFIVDYLPWANGDAMEHRNSTVITSPTSIADGRGGQNDSVSHEFFHGWNVERIRPRSLEPFNFERENVSGELWLGEGFTQYYGALTLSRAGLLDLRSTAGELGGLVSSILHDPARDVRSAVEMSRMAAFTDGSRPTDPTNWPITVISYYQHGGAIGLALDLMLRERTAGRVTLDDYMRAMWRVHGTPGGARPGYADRPYTLDDAERRLAEVSGDAAFARDFFARYVHGREAADYARLLLQAGLVLRKAAAGRAWPGDLRLNERATVVRVATAPYIGSPAYNAGLDVDDEIREMDGDRVRSYTDLARVIDRRKPGDRIAIVYVNRLGTPINSTLTLLEDPAMELLPIESAGGSLTPAQQRFRAEWLHGTPRPAAPGKAE